MSEPHTRTHYHFQPHRALYAGIASLFVVGILILTKLIAYIMSGSTGILASLIDSCIDAGVSLMIYLSIHISLMPADKNHRYGHGKVEGLASLFQAAFIMGAAVFLGLESIRHLINPEPVTHHGLGIAVMVLAIILSAGLVWFQNHTLKAAPSPAVEADKAHYSSDILVNAGVIVALGLQYLGFPGWIDPVFALCVSVWMMRTVSAVGKRGIDMLLDRELPRDKRNRIEEIIRSDSRVHDVHDIRTRSFGMKIHISFDIEVDDTLTIKEAHDIARDVEKNILHDFANAEIMIHIDPLGDTHDTRHSVKGIHHA